MKPMMAAMAAQFASGLEGEALEAANKKLRATIHGGK
jgi:hypothetical protein